ncbi:uncharacterized protein LOC129940340 [Eupeodes corollae]|uniref:uncharacterized protein LOC129940340 n=1 Tax=Eupeodes corollae TaxID=290404 RepID=UPI00248FC750|nr:uncharacterized protein LOC129940340 [Eupeodes corollae]
MNKLNAAQVEKLITLIKEHPIIFDKSDKYYKHPTKKDEIWQDISESIGAEEHECKTAWKSLRTQFVKACNKNKPKSKSGRQTSGKKNYKYYHHLLFLKDSISSRKTRPSKGDKSNEKPNENYDVLLYDEDTEVQESKTDVFFENIKQPSVSHNSTPRSSPSPSDSPDRDNDRQENNLNDTKHLKELFNTIVTEVRASKETRPQQDDIETYFVVIGNMVRNANLTTFQNRQIQKKIFNFVSDELDKLENNETNK